MRLRSLTCFIFLILFSKKNHGFIEEDTPSEKVVIAEEELNRFDIDCTENLEGLPRFVLLCEEYGNLKVVNDGGALMRDIEQTRSLMFHNSLLMFTP